MFFYASVTKVHAVIAYVTNTFTCTMRLAPLMIYHLPSKIYIGTHTCALLYKHMMTFDLYVPPHFLEMDDDKENIPSKLVCIII